jgi:serine phosphatase RsbU (regulator of sigma subunit)
LKNKIQIILFLLFAINGSLFSQDSLLIDSLLIELNSVKNDSARVDIYIDLCWKLRNSEPGSSVKYGTMARNLAEEINYNSALVKATSLLGVAYRNIGDYYNSITLYYEAQELAETYNDTTELGYTYINFGNLYNTIQYYADSKINLDKALDIAIELNNSRMQAYTYSNLGQYYITQNQYDSARLNLNKALQLRLKDNDIEGQATSYKYIGDIYYAINEIDSSLQYYFKSKNLLNFNVDKDLVSDLYNEIGIIYFNKNMIDSALHYCKISLKNAQEIDSKLRQRDVYLTLTKIYVAKKMIDSAFQCQSMVMTYNENLINQELSQKITYEQYHAERDRNFAEIKKQRTIILLLGIIVVFVFILVFVFMKLNSKNKKINRLLRIKNEEIKQQKILVDEQNEEIMLKNEEIMLKNEELNAQNDEIIKQRDEIYEQKRQITDSIAYACRIQEAILFTKIQLKDYFRDAFIFFRPRDVVSGDFYWYRKIEDKIIVIAADCTGHGVPGAFMSLLAISALEEIVFSKNILKPNEILENLRKTIKTSLKQSMDLSDSRDGIDLALCTFDITNKILLFSGANNPLYLIRDNQLEILDSNFNTCGIDLVERPFNQHEINYLDNDVIYMFSDGFADQFSPKREKFKTNRFKKLLMEIHQKDFMEQKQILEATFLNWKSTFKQIDDILIIGIKL